MGDGGVEGDLKGTGVALDLGQEQATLEAGHDAQGEDCRIGIGAQCSGTDHPRQTLGQELLPSGEGARELGPSGIVELGQLVGEGPEGATAPTSSARLSLDDGVAPALDVVPARHGGQLGPMKAQDEFSLAVDYGVDQVVFVLKVVIKLRLAGTGRLTDVVEADTGRASFIDEFRGRLGYALASLPALGRGRERCFPGRVSHRPVCRSRVDLTVHSCSVRVDHKVQITPKEKPVPTSSPVRSLKEQLDEMTANIPEAMGSRIDAGVSEIAASGVAPGLAVGDQAPEFTLPNALGRPVSLAELLAHGPVVVTFYRGEWCPYCNLQIRALQAALPSLRELGASLVAISPQAADHSLSLTEKHDARLPRP